MKNRHRDKIAVNKFIDAIRNRHRDRTALQVKRGGEYQRITFRSLGDRAMRIASFLIRCGIVKSDRVAILSENRPEWGIAFFSIITAGAVAVPVDTKSSSEEMKRILSHADVKAIFVSEKFIEAAKDLSRQLPSLRRVISLGSFSSEIFVSIQDILRSTKTHRVRRLSENDTAVIIYTSGTTGDPKGVELSCRNLIYQVVALHDVLHYSYKDRFVSLLPLYHSFEITGGLLAPLSQGITVTYIDTLKSSEILAIFREVKPTICIVVPLILKMFSQAIKKEIAALPSLKRRFVSGLFVVSDWARRKGYRIGKWIFPTAHRQFGGCVRCFVSGGAALDMNVTDYFDRLGFLVLQGYGLTETSPVLSVNTFWENRYGSVGRLLPCVEVKIDGTPSTESGEGEIVVRGPNIMRGYYKAPHLTCQALDQERWFRTGDLGWVDSDGFLYVTGRKKNLIVTGSGKNVHPEEVEEALARSPLIKEICVLGRFAQRGIRKGCEEVFAVVVPDTDACQARGIILEKQNLYNVIKRELTKHGKSLAQYKRPLGFEVWMDELPKTTTRKVLRRIILKQLDGKDSANKPQEVTSSLSQ